MEPLEPLVYFGPSAFLVTVGQTVDIVVVIVLTTVADVVVE